MLFIAFSLFTIAMATGVVFARSAIYSSLCLILSFFGLAALYVLWNAEFVAMVQILIYTGAIVVLFVFVVMLLDLERKEAKLFSAGRIFMGVAVVAVWWLCFFLLRALNVSPFFESSSNVSTTSLRSIAKLLFNEYLWPFEILSVFMLALIVAIFALTRSETQTRREA